jgi:DMSO/TMAO reductase YedYZ molybdopterin-dependent catalytic subunit
VTPKRLIGACLLVLTMTAAAVARQQAATIHVGGALIPRPLTFSASDLAAMPRHSVTASAHHLSGTWEGVELRELLTRAGVPAGDALRGAALATAVVVTGADGYRMVFAIAELDPAFTDRVAIMADRKDGAPLPANSAPFQLIITGEKRPARWVRQVVSIELVSYAARQP